MRRALLVAVAVIACLVLALALYSSGLWRLVDPEIARKAVEFVVVMIAIAIVVNLYRRTIEVERGGGSPGDH